jgi:dihydrodipicolinate synthase/N-acetylneuraminate lyase
MDALELQARLKGVFIVQMTPFNEDGSLDLEGMRANTRWLLERTAGRDFVYVPEGSNGEFFVQSEDEWQAVVKMVVEEVDGQHPVIAGAAQPGTQETIKRCQYAQFVGADGVLVVLPYYVPPEEEGVYQHFREIASSVDIGVVLYNNSLVSGCWARPPLVSRMARLRNFVAVKENTSSVMGFRLMQQAVEPDAVVLCGRGEEIYRFVAPFGCPGFVSFLSNFAPDLSYSVYEAAAAGDYEKVEEVAGRFYPFFKDPEVTGAMPPGASFTSRLSAAHGPTAGLRGGASMQFAAMKAAMDMVGLRGGEVRLPLLGITAEEKRELGSILDQMGLLEQ